MELLGPLPNRLDLGRSADLARLDDRKPNMSAIPEDGFSFRPALPSGRPSAGVVGLELCSSLSCSFCG